MHKYVQTNPEKSHNTPSFFDLEDCRAYTHSILLMVKAGTIQCILKLRKNKKKEKNNKEERRRAGEASAATWVTRGDGGLGFMAQNSVNIFFFAHNETFIT